SAFLSSTPSSYVATYFLQQNWITVAVSREGGYLGGTKIAQILCTQRKPLIVYELSMVPGGGSNPHDRKGRRILSLFFRVLQRVAADRKFLHKLFWKSELKRSAALQSVASKYTKVGNEQPSKQPLRISADFPSKNQSVCT
ncbi:MAG: hypothetical protein WBQ95_13150, partial [Terracidiphilus sp.]